MGKSHQQRRADKRRREAEQQRLRLFNADRMSGRSGEALSTPVLRTGPGAHHDQQTSRDPRRALDLIRIGARSIAGPAADPDVLEACIAELTPMWTSGEMGLNNAEWLASRRLLTVISNLWESGWQPLDIIHVVRRKTNGRLVRLVTSAIEEDASNNQDLDRAPTAWLDQLAAIGTSPGPTKQTTTDSSLVAKWRSSELFAVGETVADVLTLLSALTAFPKQPLLLPPPSDWKLLARPSQAARNAAHNSSVDPKMLAKIRALLAKAEATTFAAEAESFTAKAQDLMSRHAIDAAVLRASQNDKGANGVVTRRVHIDNPYAADKVTLLGVVGRANATRVVWDQEFGWATVFGFPVDLDLCQMLFTSLLIQATKAMAEVGTSQPQSRSKRFRRGFLFSYSVRIGERLTLAQQSANEQAALTYGTSLELVLADRSAVVDAEVDRVFTHLRTKVRRSVDARGWAAGRVAADLASLGTERDELTG